MTKPNDRVLAFLSALIVVAVAVILVTIGPAHIMAPWDVFLLLGEAWRILCHQVPHTDFQNPIGPLTYALIALGMEIGGPSLSGYVYGNTLFLVVASSWAGIVFFSRLASLHAFVLTIFVVALIAAQRPLGFDPSITTYAIIYNRYGWVLVSILFVQLFVSVKDDSGRWGKFDAISVGLLLGIIFFLKISFCLVGLLALLLSILLHRPPLSRTVLTIVGFLLVCLTMWATLKINPIDYSHDIATAWQVQSPDHRWNLLKRSIRENWLRIILCGVIWLLLVARPRRKDSRRFVRPTIVYGFTLVSAFGLTAGNAFESTDIPLFLVAAIMLFSHRERIEPTSSSLWSVLHDWRGAISYVIIVVVFFGNIFRKDVRSLTNAIEWHQYRVARGAPTQHFDALPLRDFVIPDTSEYKTAYWRAKQVPSRINDGLALIRGHSSGHEKIFTLAFTDPFSFALERIPPRNVLIWWDPNYSFSELNYPPAEKVFSDVDIVMVPILRDTDDGCCLAIQNALLTVYGKYLETHFVELARSEYWRLLVKRI
jgi:hypothetical protein